MACLDSSQYLRFKSLKMLKMCVVWISRANTPTWGRLLAASVSAKTTQTDLSPMPSAHVLGLARKEGIMFGLPRPSSETYQLNQQRSWL